MCLKTVLALDFMKNLPSTHYILIYNELCIDTCSQFFIKTQFWAFVSIQEGVCIDTSLLFACFWEKLGFTACTGSCDSLYRFRGVRAVGNLFFKHELVIHSFVLIRIVWKASDSSYHFIWSLVCIDNELSWNKILWIFSIHILARIYD
jgi:hypothetical protein